MTEIHQNPETILAEIKDLLSLGVKDRKHAFHTPVFSNISNLNLPSSKTVVLRNFDEKKFKLYFHTDFRSKKIKDLEKNNNTYFLFYDPKIKIQLRIKTISLIHYKNKLTEKIWELMSLSSKKCYLTKKIPSSKTSIPEDGIPSYLKGVDPSKKESELGYKNFTIVENIIQNIDWLLLKSSGHRRLNINLENKSKKFNWTIP